MSEKNETYTYIDMIDCKDLEKLLTMMPSCLGLLPQNAYPSRRCDYFPIKRIINAISNNPVAILDMYIALLTVIFMITEEFILKDLPEEEEYFLNINKELPSKKEEKLILDTANSLKDIYKKFVDVWTNLYFVNEEENTNE